MPTIRFGSRGMSRPPKTWASSLGASLDAQPAHETISVRRIATSERSDECRSAAVMNDESHALLNSSLRHSDFCTAHSSYHEARGRDDDDARLRVEVAGLWGPGESSTFDLCLSLSAFCLPLRRGTSGGDGARRGRR